MQTLNRLLHLPWPNVAADWKHTAAASDPWETGSAGCLFLWLFSAFKAGCVKVPTLFCCHCTEFNNFLPVQKHNTIWALTQEMEFTGSGLQQNSQKELESICFSVYSVCRTQGFWKTTCNYRWCQPAFLASSAALKWSMLPTSSPTRERRKNLRSCVLHSKRALEDSPALLLTRLDCAC